MQKSADAYRTISEVAEDLKLPQHVLRFWETRFPQVKPMKRGGNRRFYRPEDVELLRAVRILLYEDGYTIKGVQRILKEQGPRAVTGLVVKGARGPSSIRRAPPEPSVVDIGVLFEIAAHGETETMAKPEPPRSPAFDESRTGRPQATSAPGQSQRRSVAGAIGLAESLEAVLAELAECERILSAARR